MTEKRTAVFPNIDLLQNKRNSGHSTTSTQKEEEKEKIEEEIVYGFDKKILKKVKQTNCTPCIMSAAAGMLIGEFCDIEKQNCEALLEEFTQGLITLRELAEDLNADEEILKILEEEGVPLDKTLKEALEEEGLSNEEWFCELKLGKEKEYNK